MKQKRIIALLAIATMIGALTLALSYYALRYGEPWLVGLSSYCEPIRGEELTTSDAAFLHDLGVVHEDEEILWLIASKWPDIRRYAGVITSNRVGSYWRINKQADYAHRMSEPRIRTARVGGDLYMVEELDLSGVIEVKAEIIDDAVSGNYLSFVVEDGPPYYFRFWCTEEDGIREVMTDVLVAIELQRGR